MQTIHVRNWIRSSNLRLHIFLSLSQPLTPRQIARRTQIDRDSCSKVLSQLRNAHLSFVLNPDAKRSRLHWLTTFGRECRQSLAEAESCRWRFSDLPDIDWRLYGWLHYSHRSAILMALAGLMSPSTIKRHIRRRDPRVAISTGNIRVALRGMARVGIVKRIYCPKRKFPLYRLTKPGTVMQMLMREAEAFA